MKQEERQLLLRDLCARLPYGVKVCCINLSDEMPKVWNLIGMPAPHLADILVVGSHRFAAVNIEENIRPYLRPMSSMTEEESKELENLTGGDEISFSGFGIRVSEWYGMMWDDCSELVDWLNAHYFDYRYLIKKGLAIEAPEGMYYIK